MKHLSALLLLTTGSAAFAQNCFHVDYPGVMPMYTDGWTDALVRPSGGVDYLEWAMGMSVGHTGPDGQPVSENHIIHMSPNVSLYPVSVRARQDGGYLVSGAFYPGTFEANCAVGINSAGDYDWARIYMTDSGNYGASSYLTSVQERTDGYLVATLTCTEGIGLAVLDASGVPVWHNRYTVSQLPLAYGYDQWGTVVEPDNSVTVLGISYHYPDPAMTCLIHVPADGNGAWAYSNVLDEIAARGFIRAQDGSYYVYGLAYADNHGRLIHLAADGTHDWTQAYDILEFTGIGQLAGGDLLISAGDPAVDLLRVTPAGVPVGAWLSNINDYYSVKLLGVRQDSVYVQHTKTDVSEDFWTGLTVAASVDDLDCAFSPVALPTVNAGPAILSTSDSLFVTPDQLKSWSMNVGMGPEFDEINVRAVAQSSPARPGFETTVYLQALNLGGKSSGPLTRTLTYDPLLSFVNAYPTPTSTTANTITWLGPDSLDGFDLEFSYVELLVPADAGLIGTTLTYTYTVTQDSVETDLTDNSTTCMRTITGSYDPNDKEVLPRNFYHIENDSILDYTIQFQNTGNDTAFTVVVRDTLPLDVDTRTFEMGAASHSYTYSLTGNGILTFTFANILLPDSNTNEPLSHGLVNFRIKPILPLTLGQEITNSADIYFDFNDPVRTPDATVVVTDETGVRPVAVPERLTVFPVPVKNVITAVLPSGFSPTNAFAIGVDGRRMPVFKTNMMEQRMEYNVQHLAPGAYVLTLIDKSGKRMSARFTKE